MSIMHNQATKYKMYVHGEVYLECHKAVKWKMFEIFILICSKLLYCIVHIYTSLLLALSALPIVMSFAVEQKPYVLSSHFACCEEPL